ncbi:MAG: helix-hairpin-helix domain-containing protein, partial [Nanoarchaeota archaeon]
DKEFASPSIIKPKTSLELRFLAQIEGISLVLAQRLLAKFGSLKGILQASKEELQEIEGVGRVLSSKITDLALKIY